MTTDTFNPEDFTDPERRLPKGYLGLDVFNICKRYLAGEFKMSEGYYLTPHYVAKFIMADNPGSTKKVSTGAIAAIFDRWEEWNFALIRQNPIAFEDFTAHGREVGLIGIIEERKKIKGQGFRKPASETD